MLQSIHYLASQRLAGGNRAISRRYGRPRLAAPDAHVPLPGTDRTAHSAPAASAASDAPCRPCTPSASWLSGSEGRRCPVAVHRPIGRAAAGASGPGGAGAGQRRPVTVSPAAAKAGSPVAASPRWHASTSLT